MDINTNSEDLKEIIERGVEEAIDKDSLMKKLTSGKELRIKLGIDPTAADIHLGHAVAMRKLRQFQDLGHKIVLIIGDFTTLIGDPSGRTTSRPALAREQIRDNMADYVNQISRVIDIKKAEIHYNSEWFEKKPMSFLMDLAGRFTVARLIEREDFQKRLNEGFNVSMLELLYPLLQGYDSIAIKADIELGGYDQRLNLLFGRKVQRAFNKSEQDAVTVPLLIGLDGVKKMSKSVGNYIRIDEKPEKMFAQLMTLPDNLMWNYFELLTDTEKKDIDALIIDVESGKIHPRDAKIKMAYSVVSIFHNKEAADFAKEEFVRVFQEKLLPSNIKIAKMEEKTINILDLLVGVNPIISKSEARRLVGQNGIRINGQIKNDPKETIMVMPGIIIQFGKSKLFKIG